MIIGIGTDIADMERIGRLLSGERGDAFLRRVLTEAERQHIRTEKGGNQRMIEYTAGRWAAKEAVVKALGCGIGGTVGLHDIEVLPDRRGKPACTLSDDAWGRLGYGSPGEPRPVIHISITHAAKLASAFAVVERL
ncbi:holo-ACP synthase [Paenibacillus thermotolerans]|uniref:holo-ACP synthase n=1 Tax=Paenibacillus thermotolerans TaxID=3027807 RepID=UPI00236880E4|nr:MULTISPECIES: holo-ACP synthase [unclassified Paenibacillus]